MNVGACRRAPKLRVAHAAKSRQPAINRLDRRRRLSFDQRKIHDVQQRLEGLAEAA